MTVALRALSPEERQTLHRKDELLKRYWRTLEAAQAQEKTDAKALDEANAVLEGLRSRFDRNLTDLENRQAAEMQALIDEADVAMRAAEKLAKTAGNRLHNRRRIIGETREKIRQRRRTVAEREHSKRLTKIAQTSNLPQPVKPKLPPPPHASIPPDIGSRDEA